MKIDSRVTAIVLAAGKGSRMKAPPTKNKVVFELANKPIIRYTYEMLRKAGLEHIVVVVGYACESVKAALGDAVTYAVQENPQGTGHAVKVALDYLPTDCKTVISMYGDDSAFYPASLITTLVSEHTQHQAALTLVTLKKQDPTGLGRIIRNAAGELTAIVEEKNASTEEKAIQEINTGLYCFDRQFLEKAVANIHKDAVSGEYYLTDVVAYAVSQGYMTHGLQWENDSIWYGVNTPEQLAEAEARMKHGASAFPG